MLHRVESLRQSAMLEWWYVHKEQPNDLHLHLPCWHHWH